MMEHQIKNNDLTTPIKSSGFEIRLMQPKEKFNKTFAH